MYLCARDHDRFVELLDRVPDTLGTARVTLANQGVSPRVGSTGTSAPKIPVNLDMSERLGEFEQRLIQLAGWVNQQEEPNKPRIFAISLPAAEYLRAMALTMRKREYVAAIYLGLRDHERRVLSAADRPLVKRPLGECGALDLDEQGTVTQCVGIIQGQETQTTGWCDTCHREHDATQRITDRIAQAWHHVAPLSVIVRALKEAGYPINCERAKNGLN